MPADGIEVQLQLTGSEPVELELAAYSHGLPADLRQPAMPTQLTWSAKYTRASVLRSR